MSVVNFFNLLRQRLLEQLIKSNCLLTRAQNVLGPVQVTYEDNQLSLNCEVVGQLQSLQVYKRITHLLAIYPKFKIFQKHIGKRILKV